MTLSCHCHYSLLFILKLCILWQGFFFFFVYVYSCLGIKHIRPLNSLQPMCAYDDYVYCTLLLLISVPFRAMWGKNFIPDVEPYDA